MSRRKGIFDDRLAALGVEAGPNGRTHQEQGQSNGTHNGHHKDQRARGVWIAASNVEIVPPRWLWERYLLRGHLNLLAGDGDVGKSFMTMKMVQHVTTGSPWPDGTPCPKGACIIVPGEDDESTIASRLKLMDGNLEQLHILQGIDVADGQSDPLLVRISLTKAVHVAELERKITQTGAVMAIIDPVESFLDAGTKTNDGVSVRTVTNPLADLAKRSGCAVLAVAHFNKATLSDAIHRVSGHQAWFNAPRAAVCAGHDPQSENGRRLLLPYKMNLAEKPSGWGFRILSDQGVVWDGPATITAPELLKPHAGGRERDAQDKGELAEKVLRTLLSEGPVASGIIFELFKALDIGESTVKSAKERVGAKAYKRGYGSQQRWMWTLQGVPPPTNPLTP